MLKQKEHQYKYNLRNFYKIKRKLGINASAFNIKIKTKKGLSASVESFYQGSKVFENGGPYKDLYECNSLDSKKDERLKSSGELIGFQFEETKWGLNDHFYDWLYLNALLQNKDISNQILNYDAFTDIEFNPKSHTTAKHIQQHYINQQS